jgi:hypothetical protein
VKLQGNWFTGSRRPSRVVSDPFPPHVPSPRPYVGRSTGPQQRLGGTGPQHRLRDTGPQHRLPVPPRPRTDPAPPQPTFTPLVHVDPEPQVPATRFVPAIIGDELRIPILWCEFGTCVEHYTHADALGERDLRGRAQAAGWCYDLLGRLACPSCVQRDPTFWIARPPVPARRH